MSQITKDNLESVMGPVPITVTNNGRITTYAIEKSHDPIELVSEFSGRFGRCKALIAPSETRFFYNDNGKLYGIVVRQEQITTYSDNAPP